jgi:hypothetical protein
VLIGSLFSQVCHNAFNTELISLQYNHYNLSLQNRNKPKIVQFDIFQLQYVILRSFVYRQQLALMQSA